jgi:hypothetical protein
MSSNTSSSNSGISFASALGLLFIGLKLANVIQWSWLWVLSPFWLGLAFLLCFAVIGYGFVALVALVAAIGSVFSSRRRNRVFR